MEFEDRFEKLETRIHKLQVVNRIVASGVVLWFGIPTIKGLLLYTPRFEKIFEEMLGTADKLPGVTRLVIDNYGLFTAMTFVFTLVGVVSACMIPRTVALWTCGSCLFLIIGIRFITEGSMWSPLITIIQEMTG